MRGGVLGSLWKRVYDALNRLLSLLYKQRWMYGALWFVCTYSNTSIAILLCNIMNYKW